MKWIEQWMEGPSVTSLPSQLVQPNTATATAVSGAQTGPVTMSNGPLITHTESSMDNMWVLVALLGILLLLFRK